MKKIFTFLLIPGFLFLSFPQSKKTIFNQSRPASFINFPAMANQAAFADAMGYYCYVDQNGERLIKSSTENPLTSVFPGYPVDISGSSFEGGILCNMDSDSDLEVVYNIGYTVQAWNIDGSSVTGWPKNVTYPLIGAPAYGDIDGDGQAEIVVAYALGSSGFVSAFEKDGSIVTGFPVNNGYIIRSPVLADVDGDGFNEIITTKTTGSTGQVFIYKGNGTVLSGWPQPMSDIPSSSCAIGDVTNDGIPEIIAEAYGSIYAWSANGTLLDGFPYMLTGTDKTSYSSPVLADVNNDNVREIIFGTHDIGTGAGHLHIVKSDGTPFPNFPKTTNYWVYSPPAVGYIDGDNILDIALGDQVLSGSPLDKLYAWNVNGQALSGFPVGPLWAINDQVVIADIDNDMDPELVFDDNAYGEYHAYNNDGSPVSGWPLLTNGITFFNTPALADVNGDNILDMLGAGITDISSNPVTHVYLWDLEVPYDPTKITIPVFQYNTGHDGLFVDPASIPVELVSWSAECTPDGVLLKWETATELNNGGFEVERQVGGKQNEVGSRQYAVGSQWEKIGFVKGSGTTTSPQLYLYTDRPPVPGNYAYRLKQIDFDGTYKYSQTVEVEMKVLDGYSLEQNYPNPFNPSTTIEFSLPENVKDVRISVYNILGQKVAELVNGEMLAGTYHYQWNAKNFASGMYIYELRTEKFSAIKKMLLMK